MKTDVCLCACARARARVCVCVCVCMRVCVSNVESLSSQLKAHRGFTPTAHESNAPSVEQHSLGGRGLACIYVRDDTDIAYAG